ncbi:MAG: sodium:solute symporter family protein [Butyricicoccus sp.]|nr:sodium:solute symporter family protein [Butyricicoccus sp.]
MLPTNLKIIAAALIFIDLAICLGIGFFTKGKSENAEEYFIGGKKTGTILLTLTAWASFSGAGNFIGQAGRGALEGASAYWLYLGEGFCGGILMGYIIAPFLARFRYMSMPHMISHYMAGGDKTVRRIAGVAALCPNAVWPASQIMGVAYVIDQLFGIDYRVAVIVCGLVFILYTTTGGVKAVIMADAVHGAIQMVLAAAVIVYGLKMFNFDFFGLGETVKAIDPSMWDLNKNGFMVNLTGFLTGLVGATSNPIFWNRAFAAKDVATAKKAYGFTFFCNIIMVFIILTIGIATWTYNQNVGDQALVWAILNHMPQWLHVILGVAVLAACLSCADTHLNCAAANIVTDIIDPEDKLPAEKSVKYAKIATAATGVFAIFAGLFANFIYQLGTFGYTICGGVLIPIFVVGLIMRDRKSEEFRSKLSVTATKIGLGAGVVVGLAFELVPSLYAIFGGGVIPALVVTTGALLISNMFCKDQTWKEA